MTPDEWEDKLIKNPLEKIKKVKPLCRCADTSIIGCPVHGLPIADNPEMRKPGMIYYDPKEKNEK